MAGRSRASLSRDDVLKTYRGDTPPVNGRKRSLRAISAELEAQGYVNQHGKPFNPKSVMSMLGRLS